MACIWHIIGIYVRPRRGSNSQPTDFEVGYQTVYCVYRAVQRLPGSKSRGNFVYSVHIVYSVIQRLHPKQERRLNILDSFNGLSKSDSGHKLHLNFFP